MRTHRSLCSLLLCTALLATAEARADTRVSARTSLAVVEPDLTRPAFGSGAHLGLTVTTGQAERGWQVGAHASLLVAPPLSLTDNASSLFARYRPWSWQEGEDVTLTLFPLSDSRVRLGYAFPFSWGARLPGLASAGGEQALHLQVQRQGWYALAAVKSALHPHPLTGEPGRLFAPLLGTGLDVVPALRLEAMVASLPGGVNPLLAAQGLERRVERLGGSARLLLHTGAPVGLPPLFSVYGSAPERFEALFTPEAYPEEGLSTHLSFEVSGLTEELQDPDRSGQTRAQHGTGWGLDARLKWRQLRVYGLAGLRTPELLLERTPGHPPYQAFPTGTRLEPALSLLAGADWALPALGLTPGLFLEAGRPASFALPEQLGPGSTPGLLPGRTVVVHPGGFSVLAPDTPVEPLLAARATLRWEPLAALTVLGELSFTHDPNRMTFRDGEAPVRQQQQALGAQLLAQARF